MRVVSFDSTSVKLNPQIEVSLLIATREILFGSLRNLPLVISTKLLRIDSLDDGLLKPFNWTTRREDDVLYWRHLVMEIIN